MIERRPKRKTAWLTEGAMCQEFRACAESAGWIVHPETGGCDLLLVSTKEHVCVRGATIQPGDMMAVEAKLQASLHLLVQAMPPDQSRADQPLRPAADFYAVLVPGRVSNADFEAVARRIGIHVIRCPEPIDPDRAEHSRNLAHAWDSIFRNAYGGLATAPRFDRGVRERLWVPEAVVETPAGVPSPSITSRRKVDMVRFAMGRPAGSVCDSRVMRDAGVNPNVAEGMRWARFIRKDGRRNVYEMVDENDPNRPENRWPAVADALRRVTP